RFTVRESGDVFSHDQFANESKGRFLPNGRRLTPFWLRASLALCFLVARQGKTAEVSGKHVFIAPAPQQFLERQPVPRSSLATASRPRRERACRAGRVRP